MSIFLQPLQTVTVGSGGASSISFNSIPQGYTDLVVKISARSNASGTTRDGLFITFNGSSSGYSRTNLLGLDSNATISNRTSSASNMQIGDMPAASASSNTFGNMELYIPNYAGSNYKSLISDYAAENNSTSSWIVGMFADLWSNTSAITSLTISTGGGSFVQYSLVSLYGVLRQGI